MNSTRFIPVLLSLLLIIGSVNASYSMASVNALLSHYNVSSSLEALLSPVNVSYGTGQYVALFEQNSGERYDFVVNVTTTPYTIVLDQAHVFNIIKPAILNDSIEDANFSYFKAQLMAYQNSSAHSLNDCLAETGLDRGVTCTLGNYCQSCQLVPSCNKVLYNTNGPQGVFGTGIEEFEVIYNQMNQSFNTLYSMLNSINASTSGGVIGNINTNFNNVSTISGTIYQNSIFPPLANISSSQLAGCSAYLGSGQTTLTLNASAPGAPWYCNAIGYCAALNYNYTLLHVMQARLAAITSLPFTDAQIQAAASATVGVESGYVLPEVTKERSGQLGVILNTTLAAYPALVNNTQSLLTHLSNATVSARLVALKSAYSNMTINYITRNLTTTSALVLTQMTLLQSAYAKLNSTYSALSAKSDAATALIIKAQLNSQAYGSNLGAAAYSQLSYSSSLNGQISNVSQLSSQLNASLSAAQNVYSGSTPLVSFTEASRAFDAPFVGTLAPLLGLPYSGVVSLAPSLGALLAIIISIVILAIFYVYRQSLKSKKKLLENRQTKSAWRRLYMILGAILIIYIVLAYFSASAANAFAPSGAFASAVQGSSSVAIAINGTATSSETLCQSQIASAVTAMGKKPVLISMGNNVCIIGNATKSLDSCMSSYAQAGTPMVILTSSQNAGISVYSMYGTVLSVHGPDSFMAGCYPTLLLK